MAESDFTLQGIRKPVGSSLTHRLHCFWILLSVCLFSIPAQSQTTGPNDGFFLVHDFKNDWRVYDESIKAYVPYIHEIHQVYGSYSIILDLAQNRHYYLLYRSSQQNYLFINGSLQKQLPENSWTVFKIDSLYKQYPEARVLITLYGTQPDISQKTLQIGHKVAAGQKPIYVSESLLQARPRDPSSFENFYVIAALILLLGYALSFRTFPRSFIRYFSIKDLLTIQGREGVGQVNRGLFEVTNLLFLLLISFLISFIFQLVFNRGIDLFRSQSLLMQEPSLGMMLLYFLLTGLFIFIVFIFKYLTLNLLGHIYKFDKIVNIHYFKAIQATAIFYTGLGLLMIMMLNTFPVATFHWDTILFVPITFFYMSRLILLYFAINKLSDAKNLYLFSYLCIGELVPFIVGLKFAL